MQYKSKLIAVQHYSFFSNCERLDVLVQKEPPVRRQNSKIRVEQLKYDVKHLQSSFHNMQAKQYEKERFEREREELLHTKFTTNANAANGASDTSILIGNETMFLARKFKRYLLTDKIPYIFHFDKFIRQTLFKFKLKSAGLLSFNEKF